jgi:hypothetical protein
MKRRQFGLTALAAMAIALSTPFPARSQTAPTLSFGGHKWIIKDGTSVMGPGPNLFSAKNASVDRAGRLHLQIVKRNGVWTTAEVINAASLGYGTYRWTIASDTSALDPNVVLGLFTWNDQPDFAHREIDIEVAKWGNKTDPTNAQFVVQPYDLSNHLHRYVQPAGPTVLEFTWTPQGIDYAVKSGTTVVASWSYTGQDIPLPGGENIRMNLWLMQGLAPTNGKAAEVVFSDFDFCTPTGVCK